MTISKPTHHEWFYQYLLWCTGALDAPLELSWSVSVSSKLEDFLSLLVFFYSEQMEVR